MPRKSKKISNVKAEATAVKQVVNVRVGDTVMKRRGRKPRPRAGGGAGVSLPPALASRPAILTIQGGPAPIPLAPPAAQPQGVSSVYNDYNQLLRDLAAERTARAASAPPLTPNATPLTTNLARNELLNRSTPRTPFTPIAEAYAVAQEAVVEKGTYDDPLTDDNRLSGSARLAENRAQRLPATPFNIEDVDRYDDENQEEQSALVETVASSGGSYDPGKYARVSDAYLQYANEVALANRRYNLGIVAKPRRAFNSLAKVKREIDSIKQMISEMK